MKYGMIEVAACSPKLRVGDPKHNAQALAQAICQEADKGVRILVTPELGLTGYTVGDLLGQTTLLNAALDGLEYLLEETAHADIVAVVGLPLAVSGKVYNAAAVLLHGKILGVLAKWYLPNYREFEEVRYFAPSPKEVQTISLLKQSVPFGGYQVYRCLNMPDLTIGVEICEDLWVPHAPHETLAQAGATILCNLSASDQLVSKANYRRMLVRSAAARTFSGYIYCDAPSTESTQDVVFSAHNIISESGFLMAESKPFEGGYAHTQIDLERLTHERKCRNTFETKAEGVTTVDFAFDSITTTPLTRVISPFPFVPEDKDTLKERAEEILALQSHGLAR
ncbi:MAG: NAD(+) synthase, partial [Clostridia bacterium]|nr:NAD(+) synthase [Clostridia bacterium]